jgi:integrase/recombinase XerD
VSGLRTAAGDYLTVRRRLGFKLERAGRLLPDFVTYLERAGATTITSELALAWARQTAEGHSNWRAERLGIVRSFARHLRGSDPCHEVPPASMVPRRTLRATPYLYSEGEVVALMRRARLLSPTLRAATYETVIGLLAATGMRVGEVIRLDRSDLDWHEGLLAVRSSKFGKYRELVLHSSTVAALLAYDDQRRRLGPRPRTPAFFVSTVGTRLLYNSVHFEFHKLVQQVGIEQRSERCRPRPHDLRHTFAVNALLDWYRQGLDVGSRMHLLTTYLGHTEPANTYWYLSAAPELLALAGERLERRLGELP